MLAMHPADEQRQSQNPKAEDNDGARLFDVVNIRADDAAKMVSGDQDETSEHSREEVRNQGHKG